MPLKCDKHNNPDWTTLQDAWWLTVDLVNQRINLYLNIEGLKCKTLKNFQLDSYEIHGMYPMDSSVELRLHSGSRRILNAVSGNECGSIAIDLTSTPIVPEWLWSQFRADIAFRFQHFNDGTKMQKVLSFNNTIKF